MTPNCLRTTDPRRQSPWRRLLLPVLLLVSLPLAGSHALAGPEEGGAPAAAAYKGDAAASAMAYDEGEAAREELRWRPAADAYWRAIEADAGNYRAHVRYQEASLASGTSLDDLTADYGIMVTDYPGVPAMRLHRLRLAPPAERQAGLMAWLKQHPNDPDGLLETGRAHLALGEPADAVRVLTKVFAVAPAERTDVLLLLAEAEHRAEKTDHARKRLEAAVTANAQFWLGHLQLARLDMLAEAWEGAQTRAATVLAQRPSYIAAFLIRSEAYAAQGKVDEAVQQLRSAQRIAPEAPEVLIALADLLARDETEKSYAESVALYRKVLETRPEDVHARYGLGWVLERQKKYDEAEEQYREVAAIDPASYEAVNSIGYCLLKQGRVTEAQAQFKRAVDMNEDYVTALANLGATYDAQSKYGDAIKIYEKILKMKAQRKNLRVIINCAFDYEALTSYAKAAKLLEQAHDLKPQDANILVWLGDNTYFQKKWKKAASYYQEAIGLDETSYFAWRGLGFAHIQRKKWEDAINALRKAAELNEDDKDSLILIGDIYLHELENDPEALKAYKKYVERGGDDPDVLDVIDFLEADLAGDDGG